jgi:hypothetical protein
LAENGLGIFVGGGAGGAVQGGAFGGIGISNFTVWAAGVALLGMLTVHILTRHHARHRHGKAMHDEWKKKHMRDLWHGLGTDGQRKYMMHHNHHTHPRNYEEGANDLFMYTSSQTLPDTAASNHDRIKHAVHRRKHKIKDNIDKMHNGEITPEECHVRIHGLAQDVFDELELPHRDNIDSIHSISSD